MPDYMTDTEELLSDIVGELKAIRELLEKINNNTEEKVNYYHSTPEMTKALLESLGKRDSRGPA